MAEYVFHTVQIVGNVFEITQDYTDLEAIGVGGFGLVWYAFVKRIS